MNFQESQDYLLSLGNEVSAMKLGLGSIRRLLKELRDPQTLYPKVQVAGTNGKGSVCAFVNSMCLEAGINVGMYTSPHLTSITERIQIEGEDIAENDFARIATMVREISEKLVADGELEFVPTFFEQVTAIALVAFAEAKVELAILETGLGGRLDATTAADAEFAVITRIDIDHQKYLGDTIEEIAAEKAAIIHAGSKVVLQHQARIVEQVIAGRCREVGVSPVWSTENIIVKREPDVLPALIATFATARSSYGNILLWNMLGEHQIENAALSIGVAECLKDAGFAIDSTAIELGLETARHPGRLEFVDKFLLDGAHNIGGARVLRNFLDDFIHQPVTMIFGAMDDKNVSDIGEILFPKADNLILTKAENSRALTPAVILDLTREYCPDETFLTENVVGAIDRAGKISTDKSVIVVTGSLYLVGEVRSRVIRNN